MRILIVDSRKPIVEALRGILEPEGYEVQWCRVVAQADEKLRRSQVDLCLLGAGGPQAETNGSRLDQTVRRLSVETPVAVVIDSLADADERRLKRAGASGYISLQWPPQRIVELTRRWADGSAASGNGVVFQNIIGRCEQMQALYDTIEKVAASPTATVLIRGESGTGKELVARAIHDLSPNASQPFVEINCAALPENLLESELFGYERGAFTDAKQTKRGLLELAELGTFFMDEIGDLNHRLQIKLVKALEEKTFRRVGGTRDITVTMRIMAATNRNLEKAVNEGTFREDLYYRLNVISLYLPPLRERGNDILLLANHFLRKFNREHGRNVLGFDPEAETLMLEYPWPGNVRELKNAVERAVLLGSSEVITPAQLRLGRGHIVKNFPVKVTAQGGSKISIEIPPQGLSLVELEKAAIRRALEMANGNQCQAARLLHISRETLRYRLRKYGLAGRYRPTGAFEPPLEASDSE
jgi:DNA-binding NtrC family response regulator